MNVLLNNGRYICTMPVLNPALAVVQHEAGAETGDKEYNKDVCTMDGSKSCAAAQIRRQQLA